MTGWVAIEGGQFVEDNLNEFFGGWHDNGNSISVNMADVALMSRKSDTQIKLDASYIPAIDSEYTLEIITEIIPAIDTDNTMNTFGYNFNYEGELNRMLALNMGGFQQYWGVVSDLYNGASSMYNANYFIYRYLGDATPAKNNTPGRSDNNIALASATDYLNKIHTLTYEKVKDGENFDINQSIVYGATTKTAKPYDNITITEANTADFYLLKNVPNVTYSIRLYNRALNSAEKAQNHFVDLCAYFGADISSLLELPDGERAQSLTALGEATATETFKTTDKAANIHRCIYCEKKA